MTNPYQSPGLGHALDNRSRLRWAKRGACGANLSLVVYGLLFWVYVAWRDFNSETDRLIGWGAIAMAGLGLLLAAWVLFCGDSMSRLLSMFPATVSVTLLGRGHLPAVTAWWLIVTGFTVAFVGVCSFALRARLSQGFCLIAPAVLGSFAVFLWRMAEEHVALMIAGSIGAVLAFVFGGLDHGILGLAPSGPAERPRGTGGPEVR